MSNQQETATPRRIQSLAANFVRAQGAQDTTALEKLNRALAKLVRADQAKVNTLIAEAIRSFTVAANQPTEPTEMEVRARTLAGLVEHYGAHLAPMTRDQLWAEAERALPINAGGLPYLPWTTPVVITRGAADLFIRDSLVEFYASTLDDTTTADLTLRLDAVLDGPDEATNPELEIINSRWGELNALEKDDIIRLLLNREFTKERVDAFYAEYE